ncbi:MAG: hypothetical protein LUC92_01505 [Clostridiales bacterium]|nr:hypothetical protein [Clostridiales bacterium]
MDENGEPIKRRKPPLDENGEPVRRKRPPLDENGEPIKRRKPPTDENGEPIRRKRPPLDENGEPIRRKRPPSDENGEPTRRKKPTTDDSIAPVIHRRPLSTDKKKKQVKLEKRQVPRKQQKRRQGDSRFMENKDVKNSPKPNKKDSKHSERDKRSSSRGCMFPIFLILICVAVFVASFSIFVGFMQYHSFDDLVSLIKGEEIVESETEETTEDADYINTDKLISSASDSLYNTERSGVISQISLGANNIKIYDIENEAAVLLNFDSDTAFSDEYGHTITASKLNEGDMIVFVYNQDKKLLSLKINPDAEEYTSLAVKVNTKRKLITIDTDLFRYDKNTVFRYKDSVLSPSEITEYDVITIKAIENDAWAVIMEKSHGTIKFTNYENISDLVYSVDQGDFNKIPESGELNLVEGIHTITVSSPSISDYTKEFIVKPGSEDEMNLSAVQPLRGSLIVDTPVTGAALYVDGIQRSLRNPMFLDYGSHKLTLAKGSSSVTKYVDINKEETEFYIDF